MKKLAIALVAVVAVGVTAAPASARADTGWPCPGCRVAGR